LLMGLDIAQRYQVVCATDTASERELWFTGGVLEVGSTIIMYFVVLDCRLDAVRHDSNYMSVTRFNPSLWESVHAPPIRLLEHYDLRDGSFLLLFDVRN
jgi:hypothetical protein